MRVSVTSHILLLLNVNSLAALILLTCMYIINYLFAVETELCILFVLFSLITFPFLLCPVKPVALCTIT